MKTIYKMKERVNKEKAQALASDIDLSATIIEFLMDKGYKTKEEILGFLNFSEKDLRLVSQMKDGMAFIERLAKAVEEKENIVIYGDYDGDGICATTIFMYTLTWLGAKPNYFINNRFSEGYGLNVKGMKKLIEKYPDTDLILTCDNGIVAFDGIDYAKSCGIDVIVSDHHNASPDGKLPDCPVVCEKRLDENKEIIEDFCGAELSRRLCFGLVKYLKRYSELKRKMDCLFAFSAFATITDVISLNKANHYVCKRGLDVINENRFFCFEALQEAMDAKKEINETSIGYHLGPMINAAGRINGDASIPVELFLSTNKDDAYKKALKLVSLNETRQDLAHDQQLLAKEEYYAKGFDKKAFVVLSGHMANTYHEGIAGLVAGWIVENFKKPCICLCKTEIDGVYKGSARSIEGFNLKAALDEVKDILLGYGGHPLAAGLSISEENIGKLDGLMNDLAKDTTKIIEQVEIEYLESADKLSFKMIKEYEDVLAPFGPGFEKPIIATYGVFKTPDDKRGIMKDKHIKTKLENSGKEIDLLWFNSITKHEMLKPNEKEVLVIGEPSLNEFMGKVSTQFIVDILETDLSIIAHN